MTKKIVLASNNLGKIHEFSQLFTEFNIKIIPQSQLNIPEIEETGTTFIENVILKAKNAAKLSGLPAIADDSGLTIDALNGAPGVYSARFAGNNANDKQNRQKVLELMKNIPFLERKATFHCFLALINDENDPIPIICHGTWNGFIAENESGNQGFGYDKIFYIPELNCNSAELTLEKKNQISHRANAMNLLKNQLNDII